MYISNFWKQINQRVEVIKKDIDETKEMLKEIVEILKKANGSVTINNELDVKVTKVKDKQLLDLTCEPGLIHVEFNKLQTKSHSIKMIHQVKSLTNSFDNGSYYKNCGICTIPFNCNLENINECQSIDCDRIKLLVDIWRRELNEK